VAPENFCDILMKHYLYLPRYLANDVLGELIERATQTLTLTTTTLNFLHYLYSLKPNRVPPQAIVQIWNSLILGSKNSQKQIVSQILESAFSFLDVPTSLPISQQSTKMSKNVQKLHNHDHQNLIKHVIYSFLGETLGAYIFSRFAGGDVQPWIRLTMTYIQNGITLGETWEMRVTCLEALGHIATVADFQTKLSLYSFFGTVFNASGWGLSSKVVPILQSLDKSFEQLSKQL